MTSRFALNLLDVEVLVVLWKITYHYCQHLQRSAPASACAAVLFVHSSSQMMMQLCSVQPAGHMQHALHCQYYASEVIIHCTTAFHHASVYQLDILVSAYVLLHILKLSIYIYILYQFFMCILPYHATLFCSTLDHAETHCYENQFDHVKYTYNI
jgi:hypothetical protein